MLIKERFYLHAQKSKKQLSSDSAKGYGEHITRGKLLQLVKNEIFQTAS